MQRRRGRPPKLGVNRNDRGRIRYSKPDVQPQDGPRWSREYQWLRDNFSEQALEAARLYAAWVKHRNRWLGYDERKLPGDDLSVSRYLGRLCFTGLIMTPPGVKTFEGAARLASPYEPPDLSNYESNDRESPYLGLPSSKAMSGQFAPRGDEEPEGDPEQ